MNKGLDIPPDSTVLNTRSIALVGLMGVGKTTIGRRLAKRLALPFYDSDEEIEQASGRTVKGYFKDHGEAAFRDGERRVISRLLSDGPIVLSTGGGAFIPDATREILKSNSVTVWLEADHATLMDRVMRKKTRPLLDVPDPAAKMRELIDERYPIYAEAELKVQAVGGTHMQTVEMVIAALETHYGGRVTKKRQA
jgi:shikimate kinase